LNLGGAARMVALLALTPEQRKEFEELGEAFVRQACNGNIWPGPPNGAPNPKEVCGRIWLAEIDQERFGT
jgi:hypothetical protein